MSYLLELRQTDGNVAQRIDDKDTLWLVVEAMLDGDCPVECLITKLNDNTESRTVGEEDYWKGKEEVKNGIVI